MVGNGQLPAKIKCRITPKRKEIREICQWSMIMKLGSIIQISSTKPVCNAPLRINHDEVISGCNKTSLSRKPCIPDKKTYYGTLSGSHAPSFRERKILRSSVRRKLFSSGLLTTANISYNFIHVIIFKTLPFLFVFIVLDIVMRRRSICRRRTK